MHEVLNDTIIKELEHELSDSVSGIEPLGAGGFGYIFKGFNSGLGKSVAIKVLSPEVALPEIAIARFTTEAKVLSKLAHENIVKLYRFGQLSSGSPFIIMEFVEGESFALRIANAGPFSIEQAKPLFQNICSAVSELHKHGVLHRDISSNNCMILEKNGVETAKLLDLGLVKGLTESLSGQRLTQTMEVCGSLNYLSPEACMGQKIDERTDVYALTCLLYEMLTGSAPFSGADAQSTMLAHVNSDCMPIYLKLKQNTVWPELEQLIKTGLAKAPADRFHSVEDLALALALVKTSIPVSKYKNASRSVFGTGLNNGAISLTLLAALIPLCAAVAYICLQRPSTEGRSSLDLLELRLDRTAPQDLPTEARAQMEKRVRAALDASENDKALTHAQKMVGLQALVNMYARDGNFEDSQKCVIDAVKTLHQASKPYDEQLHLILRSYADAAHYTGRYREAISRMESILQDWPAGVELRPRHHVETLLCEIYNFAGQFAKAQELEERLAQSELDNNYAREKVWTATATTNLHQHKNAEALANIQALPERSGIRTTVGAVGLRAEIANNDWKRSIALYRNGSLNDRYYCSGKIDTLVGVEALTAAHLKEWDKADLAFNCLINMLDTAPSVYYAYFADFDLPRYEQLLKEARLIRASEAVHKINSAAEEAFHRGLRKPTLKSRSHVF
jgi:serine/threonine protein kinase